MSGESVKSYVYVQRSDGHRPSYQMILSQALDVEPVSGRLGPHRFARLLGARRLIFSTIDDNYFVFLLVSLGRAILGRRTVGIFLRPAQCWTGTRYYHRWKRWVFAALRRIRSIAVLTIVPFPVRPEYALVARDWVHDPQMWDVSAREGGVGDTPLARSLRDAAQGRRILCFVGGVSAIKGIDFLADVAGVDPGFADRCLVAVMGKSDAESSLALKRLAAAGAKIVDRHLSDPELESLYSTADMIWACYRPDYDQASGVFGRAFQSGKLSLVRSGSVIEQYARHVGAGVLPIEYGDAAAVVAAIDAIRETRPNADGARSAMAMRDQFVETIGKWQ